MKYRLIAAVSQDGFIAKYPGHLPSNWTSKDEQSLFSKDINKCEWSVMGRITHELFFNIKKKRIIFTRSVKKYELINENHIFFNPSGSSFEDIINLIKPVSIICILGGTKIHDFFLENKLINELIITVEPIFFRKGLPLFTELKFDNFPNIFLQKGFKLKNKIKKINKSGSKYYFLFRN